MVVRKTDNLPEGIKYIDYYYYDKERNDVKSVDDADIFFYNSYNEKNERVEEGFGYTDKYKNELKKEHPELFEDLEDDDESINKKL